VVLTIALLCTKSFDYRGLMLELLQKDRGIDIDRVSKVDVIRGRMIVEYRDGELAVDEPIKNFHGAALKGCDECADFLGRSADLSVGSVGSIDGWSSVLVRTERGHRALDNARGGSTSATSTPRRPWSSWTPSTSGWPSTACAGRSTRTRRCSSTTPSTSPTTRGPTVPPSWRTAEPAVGTGEG